MTTKTTIGSILPCLLLVATAGGLGSVCSLNVVAPHTSHTPTITTTTRQEFWSACCCGILTTSALFWPSASLAAAGENDEAAPAAQQPQPRPGPTITPCRTTSTSGSSNNNNNNNNNNNCVSTASVRQIDLYMAPWTYPSSMSPGEALARIKGAVVTSPFKFQVVDQTETSLTVRVSRNFATDQLIFVVNDKDKVITFSSQQIEGPEGVSDFGENRQRLQELRRRIGVFGVMGGEDAMSSSSFLSLPSSSEGALGQLKAFYGFQSGKGLEDVFFDDD